MKKTMKVKQFYNKNQFIITDTKKFVFQSYDSTIALVEGEKLTLGKHWDYSITTLKHLYKFMHEYAYHLYRMVMFSGNKRKEIQRLIDNGTINYDASL